MKLLILFFTLLLFQSQAKLVFKQNSTKINTTTTTTTPPATSSNKWTNNPDNKIAYNRANHIVWFFDDKNKEGEVLNFCGDPNGFNVTHFSKSCFYSPWIMSLFVPLIIALIVICFLITISHMRWYCVLLNIW